MAHIFFYFDCGANLAESTFQRHSIKTVGKHCKYWPIIHILMGKQFRVLLLSLENKKGILKQSAQQYTLGEVSQAILAQQTGSTPHTICRWVKEAELFY